MLFFSGENLLIKFSFCEKKSGIYLNEAALSWFKGKAGKVPLPRNSLWENEDQNSWKSRNF